MLGDFRPYAPTPHRREEARRRGEAACSRDLSVAAGLIAAAAVLALTWPGIWNTLQCAARRGLTRWQNADVEPGALIELAGETITAGLLALAPALLAAFAATLGTHLLQTGFLLRPPAFAIDASRFSLGHATARLLSLDTLIEATSAVLKLLALTWAAWGAVAVLTPAKDGTLILGQALAVGAGRAIVALAVLGALDYTYRRWRFEQRLRMTRTELEAEIRETEGHPITRARRRRLRRPL